jgi:hypothetical protein
MWSSRNLLRDRFLYTPMEPTHGARARPRHIRARRSWLTRGMSAFNTTVRGSALGPPSRVSGAERWFAEGSLSSDVERTDGFQHQVTRLGPGAAEPRASGAEGLSPKPKSLAGWSGATEKTKRPSGNLDGLFFQGRIVPTEVRKNHRNFLAKILRGVERQCQGISPE